MRGAWLVTVLAIGCGGASLERADAHDGGAEALAAMDGGHPVESGTDASDTDAGDDADASDESPVEASCAWIFCDASSGTDAADEPPEDGGWHIFDSCTPVSCAARGLSCGDTSDGCGHTINCGTCDSSRVCTNNVCETPVATDGGALGDLCPDTTGCSGEFLGAGCDKQQCTQCGGGCLASHGFCCFVWPSIGQACIPYGSATACQ